jgi:hypothetical protein
MGISKGNKENYLNLYITLLNKNVIEEVLSEKVGSPKWEYYYNEKMIDIFTISESGKSVFVENQINFADKRHLDSVKEVIDKAPNNSTVIWGATGFSLEIMKSISNTMYEVKDKKVDFYAVQINTKILPILEKLDGMHVLKVMDNLSLLYGLKIYNSIFDNYVSSFSGDIDKAPYRYKRITDRERTNAYIITELRSRVKYPNVFREKRTINTNKIRYGFGREGIDIEIVNKNDESYVSCQFTGITEGIYNEIVKRKNSLENKLGKEVICDNLNMKIFTFIKQFEHKFDKIDQLVELMDNYILYLSNYTFYFGTVRQGQMWENHRDGLLELNIK